MTAITINKTATQFYINSIQNGKEDFDKITDLCLRHIKKKQGEGKCARRILELTVQAYESYLDHLILGWIQKIFERYFGNYGRAKEVLKQPTTSIPTDNAKVERILAGYFASVRQTTVCFLQKNKDTSSSILIATPKGHKYFVPLSEGPKGKGASRFIYEGKVYFTKDGKNEVVRPIGILTTLPLNPAEYDPAVVKEATSKMQSEYDTITSIEDDSDRVIRVYDNFTTSFGALDVGFTTMDYHQKSDIAKFIKSDDYLNMTPEKKLAFLKSLVEVYQKLHNKHLIHRDLRSQNILVDNNFLPVLIDLETCISESQERSKAEEVAGTQAYWSPEYLAGCLKGMEEANQNSIQKSSAYLAQATTQALDAWALGLVCFHFMFGKDLISEIFHFGSMGGSDKTKIGYLKDIHAKLPDFVRQMNAEGTPTEENWIEIKRAIQANKLIWNEVIVPLLELDPQKRKRIADISFE